MSQLTISFEQWLEVSNICDGTFAPITTFLGSKDYQSVVSEMRLQDGSPFPIPITLDLPQDKRSSFENLNSIELHVEGHSGAIATLTPTEIFEVSPQNDAKKVFGTDDSSHPGVAKELSRSPLRIAGKPELLQTVPQLFPDLALTPSQTNSAFEKRSWKKIAGFQTRNPPHRAHEYLQRVAMELCDGIFLQPLIGWKKPDDFAPRAVVAGYQVLTEQFYPKEHALLGTLTTPMRYAGPREAVFHAIIRRNHGCTHFIVGRDHAGVGGFYGKYEAQELCATFNDLGIEILALSGPYYCAHTGGIATEKTTRYSEDEQEQVSGTRMRQLLSEGHRPPAEFMRTEVADALIELSKRGELFVGDRS